MRNILAINPGTRYVGLAIFEGTDLVYWRTRMLRGRWSKEKIRSVERIIIEHVEHYHVTTIAVKDPYSYKASRNLKYLTSAIVRLAQRRKLKLHLYRLNDLKDALAPGLKVNKTDLAGLVAAQYRFLIPLLEKERKNKHSYLLRMFEAAAAGMAELARARQD
jgi:Holliday junction resolvasome RuvABC endonuclease subunit